MKYLLTCILYQCLLIPCYTQDLSQGLIANDLEAHPMQAIDKPAYLASVEDPSFGTTIRRISDAQAGETIRSMYSTVQAWNADEGLMILYKRPGGIHILLDGMTYEFIKELPINPADLEEVFWHFQDPEVLFYMDRSTQDLISYNVVTDTKSTLTNLSSLSNCTEGMESGNDVQMMSWDSDIFTFRCGNESTWIYSISKNEVTQLSISDPQYTAAMPFPSGTRFLHQKDIYDLNGDYIRTLDISSGSEHSCLGQNSEGEDTYYSVAFSESPGGGCLGEVIAYNPTIGNCRTIVGTSLGYSYTQSGTHISALSHKNTEGGWIAASMMGYDQDGQALLDQELIIAKISPDGSDVYRIGHHRSDEDQFDYWGEPHPVISPRGTRVLFNSDWSGDDDGFAVDAYVVELPSYDVSTNASEALKKLDTRITISPNPVHSKVQISGIEGMYTLHIYDINGRLLQKLKSNNNEFINLDNLSPGLYFLQIYTPENILPIVRKIIKQ